MNIIKFVLPISLTTLLLFFTTSCSTHSYTSKSNDGLTILQMNDVYKIEGLEAGSVGGLARLRTLRQYLEAEGRPVLVLHGGDILFPSVIGKYLLGKPMIEMLNLLDGDPDGFDSNLIVTFGNHEFDKRDEKVILNRLMESDFHWVSSNSFYKASFGAEPVAFPNTLDTFVREVGGVKVGIFGITIDSQNRNYVHYEYSPRSELHSVVAQRIKKLQKSGAEFIIGLTHQDMAEDIEMAKRFPEIHLIIGGHEHFAQERQIGKTWITKADADLKSVKIIDIRKNKSGKFVTGVRHMELGVDVPEEPAMAAAIADWQIDLAKTIKDKTGRDPLQKYAVTEHKLEGVEPAVRGRETALGNFLADVIRERMNTELAFLNGGAIRNNDNIPAGGNITGYDLEGIFYFNNKLVSFELSGSEILELLKNSVSKVHLGDGRFLQVSGIRFKYHVSKQNDDPVYRIDPSDVLLWQNDTKSFHPLDMKRKYSVSTLDFIWKHGQLDGYKVFAKGSGLSSPPRTDDPTQKIDWRKATEEALLNLPGGQVTTKISDRIVRVED